MHNDWPTKEKDLEVVSAIINRHVDLNDGQPLGLLEITFSQGEKVDIKMSEWVLEIAEYFNRKYGPEQGSHIIKHILTGCMINGDTIH